MFCCRFPTWLDGVEPVVVRAVGLHVPQVVVHIQHRDCVGRHARTAAEEREGLEREREREAKDGQRLERGNWHGSVSVSCALLTARRAAEL